ncbi:MAG: RagB/SusD family nutrient uptake outer membrane protein [Gemmatimonadota bacterium]|nr:RagB/SusD family nutrient uptake outer membrane protein [Gemmatimonadota bacterium]
MKTLSRGRNVRPYSKLVIAAAFGLASCDLKVSNPGPVEDSFLGIEAAHNAIVYGAMRAFNSALGGDGGNLAMCGAVVAREWFPAGQTGSFACSVQEFRNQLVPAGAGIFDRAQLARWLAEQGVSRIKEVRGAAFAQYPLAAPLLLYVGYANRQLGEHVCTSVIDGGPQVPFTVHFERAEAAFTEALALATSQNNAQFRNAALAGRASVRIWRNNWAGASADAALVPKDFVYATPYNIVAQTQSNSLAIATTDQVRRNFSQWATFYGENFDQYKDPRTPYRKFPDTPFRVGLGSLPDLGDGRGALGAVQYWQQRKHVREDGPIDLSTGRESMLIVAEARLRSGDWPGAMAIVNEIRTLVGVAPKQAANSDEAWTAVKLEKLIELWLEGRALGERRRWLGDGPDGAAPGPLPASLRMDDRTGKDRCWPISQQEAETNPNLKPNG